MSLGPLLALTSACLNATAATFAMLAYRAVRRKDIVRHRKFMLWGFGASCVFLVAYVTRIALFGDTRFSGVGTIRIFYLALLASHVLLAISLVPMIATTLWWGLRRSDAKHRKIARYAFPVWVYVSVTGVVVYFMLYHLPKA